MNSKSYKAMTIVFSILIIAAVALFYVGMLALPISSAGDAKIYTYVEGLIDAIKSIGTSSDIPSVVAVLLTTGLVTSFALIFGIVGIVYTIILLIKSIKGLCTLKTYRGPLRPLTNYGISMVMYTTLLLGILAMKQDGQTYTLGMGPILVLVSGLICLVAAAYYHFTDKTDRRITCNILDLFTSAIGITGVMIFFAFPIMISTYHAGYFVALSSLVTQVATMGSMPDSSGILAIILTGSGIIFAILSIIFARGVIANGFCVKLSVKKKADYAKSSIVKSIFWMIFTIAAVVLLFVSAIEFRPSAYMIAGAAMSGVAFILAIVNKVFQGKPGLARPKKEKVEKQKPQYRYYDDDDEVIVQPQPRQEAPTPRYEAPRPAPIIPQTEVGFTPIPVEDEPAPAPAKKEEPKEDEGFTPIPFEE